MQDAPAARQRRQAVKATVSRILTMLELDNRVQIAVVVRGSAPR